MIAAIDTQGQVYFSLSHAKTDQDVFMLFLRHLVATLDRETPAWREDFTDPTNPELHPI